MLARHLGICKIFTGVISAERDGRTQYNPARTAAPFANFDDRLGGVHCGARSLTLGCALIVRATGPLDAAESRFGTLRGKSHRVSGCGGNGFRCRAWSAAHGGCDWGEAYDSLRRADAEAPLDLENLQAFAEAAYFTGRVDECLARGLAYIGSRSQSEKRSRPR